MMWRELSLLLTHSHLASNHQKCILLLMFFKIFKRISHWSPKMNTKEKAIIWHTAIGICIHRGRTESSVKALVQAKTNERTDLHQEDGRQCTS